MTDLYDERGQPRELTDEEKRVNTLVMALTNASHQLVEEHGFTPGRVHELVERALKA